MSIQIKKHYTTSVTRDLSCRRLSPLSPSP